MSSPYGVRDHAPARVECRGAHQWRVVSFDAVSHLVGYRCARCGEEKLEVLVTKPGQVGVVCPAEPGGQKTKRARAVRPRLYFA